jgi:hypothetical protein
MRQKDQGRPSKLPLGLPFAFLVAVAACGLVRVGGQQSFALVHLHARNNDPTGNWAGPDRLDWDEEEYRRTRSTGEELETAKALPRPPTRRSMPQQ